MAAAGGAGLAEHLAQRVAAMAHQLAQVEDRLRLVEGGSTGDGRGGEVAGSSSGPQQERLDALEDEVKKGMRELRELLQGLPAKNVANSIKEAEDGLRRELHEDLFYIKQQIEKMQGQMASSDQRHSHDLGRLARELAEIQVRIEFLASLDACATSRCLSCFDRRSPDRNLDNLGKDGRPYKMQRPTSSLDVASAVAGSGANAARLSQGGDGARTRGGSKGHAKVSFMGGAGAPLHQYNLQSCVKVEDSGALRSLRRGTSSPGAIQRPGPASPTGGTPDPN